MKRLLVGLLFLVKQAYCAEPAGLINLGNTCYINSTLQCLAVIPELREILFSKKEPADQLTEEFKKIIRKKPNPQHFFECVSQSGIMGRLAVNNQQDAAEFYESLINHLEPKPAVQNLFRIKQQIETISSSPDFERAPIVQENTILRIGSRFITKKKGMAIETLLRNYFLITQDDTIEVQRGGVNNIFNIKEKNVLLDSSSMLVVAVPRFDEYQNKINTPIWSTMEPFTLTFSCNDQRITYWYSLIGCVSHIGQTIDSGHYTALVLHDNQWFDCNDKSIAPLSRGAAGAKLSRQTKFDSYIYFFRRIPQLTLREPIAPKKQTKRTNIYSSTAGYLQGAQKKSRGFADVLV